MHLSLKKISKSFNLKPVLNNLNLEVESKSTVGIIGENGSGKTTLLKIISGFMKPESGIGRLSEDELFSSNYSYLNHIFYWGHTPDTYSSLSALENLRLFLQLRNDYRSDELIKKSLMDVGLEMSVHQSMAEFSAGMLQRYHIARMELSNWDILILDEPTNALDKNGLSLLENSLANFRGKKTFIISSHNIDFIHSHCDNIYKLSNGDLKSR